jgi:hypothetical protein
MGTPRIGESKKGPIEKSVDKFVRGWDSFDEDVKEIIAGALYVLGRTPEQVVQSHHLTRYCLNPRQKDLLNMLSDYTMEN